MSAERQQKGKCCYFLPQKIKQVKLITVQPPNRILSKVTVRITGSSGLFIFANDKHGTDI